VLSPTGLLPPVVSEFHCSSASSKLCDSRRARHSPDERPTTPNRQRVPAYTCRVWAIPLSLATTRGVSVDFLSSGY
jgi:hypothetical protein